jgi:hypothetical protein
MLTSDAGYSLGFVKTCPRPPYIRTETVLCQAALWPHVSIEGCESRVLDTVAG